MTTNNLTEKLTDNSLLRQEGLIDGQWLNSKSSAKFDVHDPASGAVIASIADMSIQEARSAIDSADEAQKKWATTTGKERAVILRRFYDLVMEAQEDLATIITCEMGKPYHESLGEVSYGASYIEWFGEEAKRVYGDTIPGQNRSNRLVVIKQPVGTVAAITPWNFPFAMVARKIAPALAAGCAIVFKPACETPLSALALGVLSQRAGLPNGLFSIIPTTHASEFGDEVCSNPKIRKLTFTGSTNVGRLLMEKGSKKILKLSLELGGNAPFIVFDDANVDEAVQGALQSKFRNNGQTCICANRIYVQNGIHDEFVDKLAKEVSKLKIGNGFEKGVSLGPLINESAVDKFNEHINDAISKGAEVVFGGGKSPYGGNFVEPTILKTVNISTEAAPFGGVKQSGFGREGSKYGLDDYLSMKYICMSVA